MMTIHRNYDAGEGTELRLGHDTAYTGPKHLAWYVAAQLMDGAVQSFQHLDKDAAFAVYQKLLPEFIALDTARDTMRKAVKALPRAVVRSDGRHVQPQLKPQLTGTPGVDYSRPVTLLAKDGPQELWWMQSGKYWDGWSSTSVKTALALVNRHDQSRNIGRTDRLGEEGGRLTLKRLLKHADEIEAAFGWDIVQYLAPGRTVIVTTPKKDQDAA